MNKAEHYELPIYWACYLINGDTSGLEDGEQEYIDKYTSTLGACVSCDEDTQRFTWSYYLYGGQCAGGTVMDYTFLVEVK